MDTYLVSYNTDPNVTYIRPCYQALIKRQPIFPAIDLRAAGKCSFHQVVDAVCSDMRESLLNAK